MCHYLLINSSLQNLWQSRQNWNWSVVVYFCRRTRLEQSDNAFDLRSVLLKRYEKLSVHWETLQKHSSTFWNIRCVSRIRVETFKCIEDHYQSVAIHSQCVENSLKRISMQFSFSLVFQDRVTFTAGNMYCWLVKHGSKAKITLESIGEGITKNHGMFWTIWVLVAMYSL